MDLDLAPLLLRPSPAEQAATRDALSRHVHDWLLDSGVIDRVAGPGGAVDPGELFDAAEDALVGLADAPLVPILRLALRSCDWGRIGAWARESAGELWTATY